MSGYLIDTNVISEYGKPEPSNKCCVGSKGLIRMLYSSASSLWAKYNSAFKTCMSVRNAESWSSGSSLVYPGGSNPTYCPLQRKASKRGLRVDMADGLIAATALEHDLAVVTRNTKDFIGLGVDVVNPWNPESSADIDSSGYNNKLIQTQTYAKRYR